MKALLLLLITASSWSANLEIKVSNLKSKKGSVQIALWNSPTGFPSDYNTSYVTLTLKTHKPFSAQIKDLKPGTYAIAIYHDKNNDQKLNTNFLGIPKEGFGFSKNPTIFTGPPKFSKAKFIVKENEDRIIKIKLKHF